MKVTLSIKAVIADYTCNTPELEMYVYPELEDAKGEGDIFLELEVYQLPRYGVHFKYPTTNAKFKKWLELNKKWANKVAPYIDHQGFK